MRGCRMDACVSGQGPPVGPSEQGNEQFGFNKKCEDFLTS
jgi:hypothetical protein